MIATTVLGFFCILFAYLARYKNINWGLKISFTLIFLFLALRYNFGNDYEEYFRIFNTISQNNQIDFNSYQLLFIEPGWILLNWLFRHLGFFAMNAVLAFFSCIIYYRFIKKYVPKGYYWIAIFIYIFSPDFMLIHSSAMRQSVAIMLFIFSLDYLYKKQAIRYFICIGFASLFHFSAIILIPLYLVVYLNQKIRVVYGFIFVSVFLVLYLLSDTLLPYTQNFISFFNDKYEFYQERGEISSGFGIIYYFIILILIIYYDRMQNREIALVFKIAIVGFLMMPLKLIILMFGRLMMYYTPALIIVYPNILMNLKKPIRKILFLTLLIVFTMYQFYSFFYSTTYHKNFIDYNTIFSASQWQ